jgi:hypothetical protein
VWQGTVLRRAVTACRLLAGCCIALHWHARGRAVGRYSHKQVEPGHLNTDFRTFF